MLINELSKRTGITSHTIRFYEKSGLIKGVRDENIKSNNYFHYDEETVEKLELIPLLMGEANGKCYFICFYFWCTAQNDRRNKNALAKTRIQDGILTLVRAMHSSSRCHLTLSRQDETSF